MSGRAAVRRRLALLCQALCHRMMRRPEALAFLPALSLAAYWLGGEAALIVAALAVPAVLAAAGWPARWAASRAPGRAGLPDPATGLPQRRTLEGVLDRHLRHAQAGGAPPACIVLALVEGDALARHLGHAAFTALLVETRRNIAAVLRPDDMIGRLDGACFAVALAPFPRPDVESLLQVAARIQAAVEVEFRHSAARLIPQTCIGGALAGPPPPGAAAMRPPDSGSAGTAAVSRLAAQPATATDPACILDSGSKLLEAAEIAMDNARAAGPGTIRTHTAQMLRARSDQMTLRADLAEALRRNELIPHFQPQLCARTGQVTGFEVLVRWRHPRRGLLAPAAFLDALVASGLSAQLGDLMLGHALGALRQWDMAGHTVPGIGVNFSAAELRRSGLPDRIAWELDRYGIAPERLVIEILETVLADAADHALHATLGRLRAMGCRIDLDDFGTGHASFGGIRRFGASRLKIDRSFVTGASDDRARQDMIAAIVSMADQLGLDTVAEGVEGPADHAVARRLGCRHLQGYGIARPMPLESTLAWLAHHAAQPRPQVQEHRLHSV